MVLPGIDLVPHYDLAEGLTGHPARSDDVGSYEGFAPENALLTLCCHRPRIRVGSARRPDPGPGFEVEWRSAGDALVAFVGRAARALNRARDGHPRWIVRRARRNRPRFARPQPRRGDRRDRSPSTERLPAIGNCRRRPQPSSAGGSSCGAWAEREPSRDVRVLALPLVRLTREFADVLALTLNPRLNLA